MPPGEKWKNEKENVALNSTRVKRDFQCFFYCSTKTMVSRNLLQVTVTICKYLDIQFEGTA
jgi:hypothetical protein